MPAVSLTDLQQQIAQREQELQTLREELQVRQSHFTELARRKEQLQSELRQVEVEIAALAETPEPPVPAAPTVPLPEPSPGQPRLGDLIVAMLHEAAKPMTARQLSDEAGRRGWRPSGKNPLKSVVARLQALKNKGIVRRASGQLGYVLPPSTNGAKKEQNAPKTHAKGTKLEPVAKKVSRKETSSAKAGKSAKSGQRGEQPSLREVVTDVLISSRTPLPTRELAELILATGYHSESRDFLKVVSAQLSKMPNVELVRNEGYRLKKK